MEIRINGVLFKIEYSFLLILSFALLSNSDNVLLIIAFSALHEMGHLASLISFGYKPDSLTLSYYGIALKHSSNLKLIEEFVFLLSGIAINLLFIVFDIYKEINLAIFIINALPLYPLDGGRVCKLLLNRFFDINASDRVFIVISIITIALFFSFAIYYHNISLVLILIYVFVYMVNNSFD